MYCLTEETVCYASIRSGTIYALYAAETRFVTGEVIRSTHRERPPISRGWTTIKRRTIDGLPGTESRWLLAILTRTC